MVILIIVNPNFQGSCQITEQQYQLCSQNYNQNGQWGYQNPYSQPSGQRAPNVNGKNEILEIFKSIQVDHKAITKDMQ